MKRVLLAVMLCGAAVPGWADQMQRLITVTGEGAVQAVPDMAMISVGVSHQDRDAAAAMAQASTAAAEVLNRLTALGVGPADMQTSQVNLSPVYGSRSSGDTVQIDGFRAELTMQVRVRDLPALGRILGAVVQDGANQFSGLQFGLLAPEAAQDAARQAAVAEALRKAQILAQAAGVNLGQVVSISENGGGGGMPMMRMAADSMADVPIAQGELTMRQSVTLVIALN